MPALDDPQALAQELREHCVASTLDLLQHVSDMLSPANGRLQVVSS